MTTNFSERSNILRLHPFIYQRLQINKNLFNFFNEDLKKLSILFRIAIFR
ncbi:Uncharacterised protein [Klebsiella pneumoniae]|nr:Uncharacterised protein [Klebsiella pneumoniae]